jgi:hypothetical protein
MENKPYGKLAWKSFPKILGGGGGLRHHHLLETLSNLKKKIGDPKNVDMPKRQKIKIK